MGAAGVVKTRNVRSPNSGRTPSLQKTRYRSSGRCVGRWKANFLRLAIGGPPDGLTRVGEGPLQISDLEAHTDGANWVIDNRPATPPYGQPRDPITFFYEVSRVEIPPPKGAGGSCNSIQKT